MPKSILKFEDNRGILHNSEEEARHANGRIALAEYIIQEFGSSPTITLNDVLDRCVDWTNIYLGAKNA